MNIDAIILAAENGGKEINKYFGEVLEIEEKLTVSDFRTKADTESEKAILNILTKEFPHYNIFSEESGLIDNKSEYTFIIDPLDGSNNFVLGIPNFSVSIALVKNDRSIAGVIHHPVLNQTYHAEEGKGTFLNKKRLEVSKEADIKRATISYTCGYVNSSDYEEELINRLHKLGIKRYITPWSPAIDYCLLASGKIEAVINNANEIYDFAAGKIIVREAGGLITSFDGKKEENDKENVFLASNGTDIHDLLVEVITI